MRVRGEGPKPCRVMFIGEAPGETEDRTGRPFDGKSGAELDRHLNGYELPAREDVYVTNLVKERPPNNADPTQADIERDEPELWIELEEVQPEVIVTLGRIATRYFLGDVDMDTVHGIPHRHDNINLCAWDAPPMIFPCRHPAEGLHSPEKAALFVYDMQRLGLFLRGELPAHPIDHQAGSEDYRLGFPEGEELTSVVAIDTEGLPGHPWGLSASCLKGEAWVVRASDSDGLKRFANALRAPRRVVVLHNSLHDLPVLRELGVDLVRDQISFTDTMVMAYLLGLEPQGLKPLAYRHAGMQQDSYDDITAEASERIARDWFDHILTDMTSWPPHSAGKEIGKAAKLMQRMPDKKDVKKTLRQRWADCRAREILQDELGLIDDMPEATLDDVPEDRAIRYSARDPDCTKRIYPALSQQIDAMGLRDVLDADIAALPMIDRMQSVGLKVDVQHYTDLSELFALEMGDIQDHITQAAGHPVNAASGDQVAEWLFGKLKLSWGKRTKKAGRPTTDDKALEALRKNQRTSAEGRAAVELVQEFREVQKLKRTYCDQIPGFVNPRTGRLHPQFRITRTATGRLSAKSPNLLAFPKHSDRGMLIREGIIADDGHLLGSWDLDQIDMRIMAIDSGDDQMIAEFLSGVDKHCATAAIIFGRDASVIFDEYRTKVGAGVEQRFAAKAVNFGILMGITEHGLLSQFHKNGSLNWTLEQCADLLREWHRVYPACSSYIYAKHAEARRYGYVRDLWGRLRYLPGVHSSDKYLREEALRQAQATPIQSGAQGVEKRLMAAVWRRLPDLWQDGIWVEPLLQVHDDLVFEFDESAFPVLDAVVHDALGELQMFPIPITCKGASGRKWSDL